jgi:hypothetical protein
MPLTHRVGNDSPVREEQTTKSPEAMPAAPPSAINCDVEYQAGKKKLLITYEASGVVYAINGHARALHESRGWIDGKSTFEPRELLRMLDEGLKRCDRGSTTAEPIAATGRASAVDSVPLLPRMSVEAFTKAANDGDGETIDLYLKAGFNVNARTKGILGSGGSTAVEAAAASGQCQILKRLLAAGGNEDPKEVVFGFTPLSLASQKGSAQCVKLLLERGVRVDVRTQQGGDTALILAAYQGAVSRPKRNTRFNESRLMADERWPASVRRPATGCPSCAWHVAGC